MWKIQHIQEVQYHLHRTRFLLHNIIFSHSFYHKSNILASDEQEPACLDSERVDPKVMRPTYIQRNCNRSREHNNAIELSKFSASYIIFPTLSSPLVVCFSHRSTKTGMSRCKWIDLRVIPLFFPQNLQQIEWTITPLNREHFHQPNIIFPLTKLWHSK